MNYDNYMLKRILKERIENLEAELEKKRKELEELEK